MHGGRISDPLVLDGEPPVAPSAVAPPLAEPYDSPWPKPKKPYVVPRELSHADILATIDDFVASARRAQDAGLDGVEIHRSEEHTSELQSLMRISYAVFCLKKKTILHKQSAAHY